MITTLLKDFYKIRSAPEAGSAPERATVEVSLNPAHEVYKGHFPKMAVVPGVCQVQMVKEILELLQGKQLMLVEGTNIKFLAMIDPDKNGSLTIEYEVKAADEMLQATVTIRHEAQTFLKFKGKFSSC